MLERGLKRLLLVLAISFVLVLAMSEVAYAIFRQDYDRPAQDIELVIPAGTAERVAEGEEVPSIPDELIFITGDTLVVVNEDTTVHELGPLVIPPGSSASLQMDDESNYDYTCSFRPSQYLGLQVRQGTTLMTRLVTLGYVAPATAAIMFVYSLIVFPLEGKKPKEAAA